MNRKQIKGEAKAVIKKNWGLIFVACLVVNILIGTSFMAIGILAIPLVAGLYYFSKKVIKEDVADLKVIIEPYKNLNRAALILLAYIFNVLIVAVGLVLLIVPGIIVAIMFSQTINIMAEDENISIKEAFKKSADIMNGHKWEYFVFQLSFIGHILLTAITFGIWSLYFIPFHQISMTNYYLHLTGNRYDKNQTYETVEPDAISYL